MTSVSSENEVLNTGIASRKPWQSVGADAGALCSLARRPFLAVEAWRGCSAGLAQLLPWPSARLAVSLFRAFPLPFGLIVRSLQGIIYNR